MEKHHGVVLEKQGQYGIVLTNEGTFIRMKCPTAEVGQEIPCVSRWNPQQLNWILGLVASVFLIVVGSFGWNLFYSTPAVASLSLDINPRLELTFKSDQQVTQVEAQNEDAARLVQGLELKGKELNEAVNEIIEKALEMKFITPEHSWVVMGVKPLNEGEMAAQPEVDIEGIADSIEKRAQKKGVQLKVAGFKLSLDEGKAASDEGLTAGEYALWQSAKRAGVEVEGKSLKNRPERVRILELSEVQQEMSKGKSLIKGKPEALSEKEKDKEKEKGKETVVPEGKRGNQNSGAQMDKQKGNSIK